jgi:hypothetical protein
MKTLASLFVVLVLNVHFVHFVHEYTIIINGKNMNPFKMVRFIVNTFQNAIKYKEIM